MSLPNLIVIGAHKCGTTSLHRYLDEHPQIAMSRTKELHFFVKEVNWDRGVDWYRSYFDRSARVRGESSPSYTNYPTYSGVPERMYSVVPKAKLIFMVRDPIDRIVSHFRMERARGDRTRTLADAAMRHYRNPYVWQSRYWWQLRQFLDYFPLSRILIASQEELARDRRETMRRVFRFAGVDEEFESPAFERIWNTSAEREDASFGPGKAPPPELSAEQREGLVEHLSEDVRELRSHTGLRLADWSL